MPAKTVPLQGKLEEHSLSTLLRFLLQEGLDGCLAVTRGPVTRLLYIREGMIVSGSSTDRQDRLGEILIAQGKLSKADHRKYWEQSKNEGRRLGHTLVVNGRITPTDLYQGVSAQMVTILDRLQKWRKGEYSFEEGKDPEPGTALLRIPLVLYLRGGSKRPPREKAVAKPKKRSRAAAPPVPRATSASLPAGEPARGAKSLPQAPRGEAAPGELEIKIREEVEVEAAPKTDGEGRKFLEENERIGEHEFHVAELRRRMGSDPAALLGVPADAPQPAVHEAYLRLVKILHPDLLPKGLSAEAVRGAEELFREVTAAFKALTSEKGRPPEETAPAAPGRARTPEEMEEQSKRSFQQGREYIAKGNYWQAADALRQAVRLKPEDATYRQYLGLALAKTRRLHEAEEHLVEAIHLEPGNAGHVVNLGRIYASGRFFRKAREAFERALRLDPKNEAAREELVNLPEEPAPTRGKPGGGSLLRKIFGKG